MCFGQFNSRAGPPCRDGGHAHCDVVSGQPESDDDIG
jgi:hypothetical protein